MGYRVELTEVAGRAFDKLDKPVQKRLQNLFDRMALLPDPRTIGEALHGDLKGLWKYRAGEWRVIAEIHDGTLIIYVVKIAHRSKAY